MKEQGPGTGLPCAYLPVTGNLPSGCGFAAAPNFLLRGQAAELFGPPASDLLLVGFARRQGIHDPREGHLSWLPWLSPHPVANSQLATGFFPRPL